VKYKKFVWICRERFEKGSKSSCSMQAVDEDKLQKAFVLVVNQVITDRDSFIKLMTENIEKEFNEQVSEVDVASIDTRLGE